jgi:hypothetical protein
MAELLRTLNPQPITSASFRHQKVENCRISVLALIKLVTKVTGVQQQKKYLALGVNAFPEIEEHLVDHTFRTHKSPLDAIDSFGACLLLRGLHQFDETHLRASCLAVVEKLDGPEHVEETVERAFEVQPEEDIEVQRAQRRYALEHEAAVSKALREQAESANTLARLVPNDENRRRADEAAEALRAHLARNEGLYDALQLLTDVHGLSFEEAERMACSYGKYLAAASRSCNCHPPTRERWFGASCLRDVPYYNPRLHGHVINAAFDDFKSRGVYERYADPQLERLREQPRRALRALDIGMQSRAAIGDAPLAVEE